MSGIVSNTSGTAALSTVTLHVPRPYTLWFGSSDDPPASQPPLSPVTNIATGIKTLLLLVMKRACTILHIGFLQQALQSKFPRRCYTCWCPTSRGLHCFDLRPTGFLMPPLAYVVGCVFRMTSPGSASTFRMPCSLNR